MGVRLLLCCGGCDATIEVGPLRRRFHSIQHGIGGHGWGAWKLDDPTELTPEGWVMFDPYTQCTYCPTCWATIEADPEPAASTRKEG